MSNGHKFMHMSSHGDDAPGKSLDTYEQCRKCGLVRHDYRHGGGYISPNYPIYLVRGVHHAKAPPCIDALRYLAEHLGSRANGPSLGGYELADGLMAAAEILDGEPGPLVHADCKPGSDDFGAQVPVTSLLPSETGPEKHT